MDIDVRDTGPAPLIAALGRELGIVEAINDTVEWDEKQCFVDPGTHTLAMIIDILLGRSPLYLVEKNYAEMDVERSLARALKAAVSMTMLWPGPWTRSLLRERRKCSAMLPCRHFERKS